MSGAPGYRLNAVELFDLPSRQRGFDLGSEVACDMRRDRNLAMRSRWPDKNKTAPNLDGRRVLGEIASFSVHSIPSSRNTEQLRSGTVSGAEINLDCVNSDDFRPTAGRA